MRMRKLALSLMILEILPGAVQAEELTGTLKKSTTTILLLLDIGNPLFLSLTMTTNKKWLVILKTIPI